jgi:hypothetical protein
MNRTFTTPSPIEPCTYGIFGDAGAPCPFGNMQGFAESGNEIGILSAALIIILNKFVSPSHVARFVIAVIVDAVERMLRRWSLADIGNKSSKIIPLFANMDTATTVLFKRFGRWNETAAAHVAPNDIQWMLRHSMFACPFGRSFLSETTARFGCASHQTAGLNVPHRSAIAMTSPNRGLTWFVAEKFNGCPTAKSASSDIYEGRHGSLPFRLLCSAGERRLQRRFPAPILAWIDMLAEAGVAA